MDAPDSSAKGPLEMGMINVRVRLRLMTIGISGLCILGVHGAAQQPDQTRGLHVKKIEDSRPASSQPSDPKQPRTYRSTTSSASSSELRQSASASEAVIGVTLWRLHAAQASDNNEARILDHATAKNAEWSAARIEASKPIGEGERVRLSIESPSSGYLYVIDQEHYVDGSMGDPFLIFPTSRTRGGNNAVVAGRVIEVPAQEDNPPYFTLTRSSTQHIGEMLIMIVSPQPIAELPVSAEPLKVPSEKLRDWEKAWGGRAEQFELEGGAGLPYTKVEKAAGGDGSRMLTQTDPLPQTILRLNAKPGTPALVKIPLQIGR